MRHAATAIVLASALACAGHAAAVAPGQVVEFTNASTGKVVFDGRTHADRGLKCEDCHNAIFQKKREAKITMGDHTGGVFCFSCHREGGSAFPDATCPSSLNCDRCHRK